MQGREPRREFIGTVENVQGDPEGLMRVQVRVKDVHTEAIRTADLPWAEYRLPVGVRANDGFFCPVDPGDYVWVDFPYPGVDGKGDIRRPRITGGVHYAPGGSPNLPHEAWSGDAPVSHRTTGEEPGSAGPDYHGKAAFTQHGVTVEINPDGSITLTQRETGSAFRIAPDGQMVVHCEATLHLSASANHRVVVAGDSKVEIGAGSEVSIGAESSVDIGADSTVNVAASRQIQVGADSTLQVAGNAAIITGGNFTLSIGGIGVATAKGGSLSLASGMINLNSG